MQNITIKNTITMNLRRFPVVVHNHRTGEEASTTITVTKDQLQAAQVVCESSAELIERLCDRQGFTVLEIGRPRKLSIPVDLDELVREYEERQDAQNKWNYLYGGEPID